MTVRVYTCAVCRESFTSDRNETEARDEARQNFGPTVMEEDPGIVCDDCYHEVMAWMRQQHEGHA